MSTIDPNSTATLNKILEKIGVKSNDDPSLKKKGYFKIIGFFKIDDYSITIRTLFLQWKMVTLLHKWHNFQL